MRGLTRRGVLAAAAATIGALPFVRETALAEQIAIPDSGIERFESVTDGEFWAPHEMPVQIVPADAYSWIEIGKDQIQVWLDDPAAYGIDGLFVLGAHDRFVAQVEGFFADGSWLFGYL